MITVIDEELVERVLAAKPACKRLNLAHNAITRVAHDRVFARLSGLTVLDISHNRLPRLGDEFAALPSLTHLNASFNAL